MSQPKIKLTKTQRDIVVARKKELKSNRTMPNAIGKIIDEYPVLKNGLCYECGFEIWRINLDGTKELLTKIGTIK